MIRSFFKFHPEKLEVKDKVEFNEIKKRYHIYTRDELCKMVEVGDLSESSNNARYSAWNQIE